MKNKSFNKVFNYRSLIDSNFYTTVYIAMPKWVRRVLARPSYKSLIAVDTVVDYEIEGVNGWDYPDFCDAHFSYGLWGMLDEELTDDELDCFTEDNRELLAEELADWGAV